MILTTSGVVPDHLLTSSREMSVEEIDNQTFVRVLYKALLSRDPDPAGFAHYVSVLDGGTKTLYEVASEFVIEFTAQEGKTPHPFESWDKEAVAFIHLGKTGGATLHALLSKCFPESRICPDRGNTLYLRPPAYLAKYDLFSGHFDYFSKHFIPRRRVRCVSIFRDPCQKLISWYRFCRSHPATGEFAANISFRLAKELGPEEFFEHPSVLSRSDANNAYLLHFGAAVDHMRRGLLAGFDAMNGHGSGNRAPVSSLSAGDSIVTEALGRAVQRVIDLDGIGLTERFEESVELIFSTLELPIPRSIVPLNVTDELPNSDAQFAPVSAVEMTLRLSQAIERLTRYDRVIYNAARREFERRLGRRCKNGLGSVSVSAQ